MSNLHFAPHPKHPALSSREFGSPGGGAFTVSLSSVQGSQISVEESQRTSQAEKELWRAGIFVKGKEVRSHTMKGKPTSSLFAPKQAI